jgi:very-short-patch-repair endonuclease
MNRHVNARALRVAADADDVLWRLVRARRLGGFLFRRDVVIGRVRVDYLCPDRAVAVLIERGLRPSRDADERARDEWLMAAGFSVFRVPAVNVLADAAGVAEAMLAVLEGSMEAFVEAQNNERRMP